MSRNARRIVAAIILTLAPVLIIYQTKQTSWAMFRATPKSRQLGNPKASVLLVEYSDFQCPMCANMAPVLRKFMDIPAYQGKVRLAYKYFPLTQIHKNSMAACRAAECAADQDQFWPYQEQLFASQKEWAFMTDPTTSYMAIAQTTHLDLPRFKGCLADAAKDKTIELDHEEGKDRQISATPTLFVNDVRLVGTMIESDGARIIDREIRRNK